MGDSRYTVLYLNFKESFGEVAVRALPQAVLGRALGRAGQVNQVERRLRLRTAEKKGALKTVNKTVNYKWERFFNKLKAH